MPKYINTNMKQIPPLRIPNIDEKGTFVVCQYGSCAQPYNLNDIIKYSETLPEHERNGYICPSCKRGILVEPDGSANLSNHAHVIKFVRTPASKKYEKRRTKELERMKMTVLSKQPIDTNALIIIDIELNALSDK